MPVAARGWHNEGMPRLERTYTDLSRPIEEFRFVVDRTEEGLRLDAILRAHYPWHGRSRYARLIREGRALLNRKQSKPAARVRFGDEVVVLLPQDPTAPQQESADDLVILHEDEHLVAIDKPSGMAVHPVGRIRHSTLVNKLHARYRDTDTAQDRVPRLGHRLDRDTSGIVVAVLHRSADARITELFTRREVRKTYFAIVQGVPAQDEGEIDAPLGEALDADTSMHMGVRPDGLPSRTTWKVRASIGTHALLELHPHTGRTHQLRVHLAHIGHPIVADHLYGDPRPWMAARVDRDLPPERDAVLLDRLALHAHRLELTHPMRDEPLVIESPLPADMRVAWDAACELARQPDAWRGEHTLHDLRAAVAAP